MLNDSSLKVSPHGSFKVSQLCKNVAICEALKGDRYEWGNATETEPAFLVYLGCSEAEISGYLKTINTFYRCSWSEIRKPKYLSEPIYANTEKTSLHMGLTQDFPKLPTLPIPSRFSINLLTKFGRWR
jgi:hypothetical protein